MHAHTAPVARISRALGFAAAVAAAAFGISASAAAQVVISQVYGGNGNTYASDYVELHNAGTASVSIANWSIQYSSASGTGLFSGNGVTVLSGTLAPGQFYLVKLSTTTGPALPAADATGATNMAAAAGKVILVNVNTGLACNGGSTPCNATQQAQIVDLVGYGSGTNFFEGSAPAPAPSNTFALIRAANGCTDTNNNATDFAVGVPAPRNSASAVVTCGTVTAAPIVPVCPATFAVASGVAGSAALSASDADGIVNAATIVSGGASGISLAGFTPAAAAGGTANVTLSVSSTTAIGTYPVVVRFVNSDPQAADCTVNVSVAAAGAFTPIYDIQGSGSTSPLAGQIVTTQGVVTKVNNNGYYLQDEVGDGNAATSDGIFVFTSTAPTVTAGQKLQVKGTVTEFNTGAAGNAVTSARPVTEIGSVTSTLLLGTGTIVPTVITLPLANADDMERYEGMLVQINTPLTASQNYFQGRYGQVTLSAGGRLVKPSNIYRPGTQQALDLAALNARNSLMLDDGTSAQNPNPTPYLAADNTLRTGDTLPTGVTGVIDFGLTTNDTSGAGMYRIHPTAAPTFTRSNPRTTAPPAQGGNVKVASFNVLNFFTTFTDGATASGLTGQGCYLGGGTPVVDKTNCRGADSLAEFIRQRDKIVQAMKAIDADVFGLMEIQNDVDTAKVDTAVQTLVDGLNAAIGSTTYAVVPRPSTTGTDAIRVAMIYKPAALTLVGSAMTDGSAINNRPPFAQTFQNTAGEKFSVVVNHMKSKSCSGATGVDADQLDGQGCYNDRRKQQATALLSFIDTIKATSGDPDVLVIGDLNAYGKEDPIDILTTGGLVDQVSRYNTNDYSYVFDGELGYIDHALATPSLSAQTPGTTHWHINADEPSIIDYNLEFKQPACGTCGPDYYTATPYRASDHDPVIVGLGLGAAQQSQTITFIQPPDQVTNSSFTLSATASSGLTVSFSSLTPAVCTVSGTLASMLTAGTCTIAADQAGSALFLAAPQVQRSFVVGLSAQSITFPQPADRALNAGAFDAGASASSGLPVSLVSQTGGVCTVSGQTVTLVSVGTCVLLASQPGNAAYAAATAVARSFAVQATVSGGSLDGDVPLPPWALGLLGAGLAAALVRRGGAHSRT